MSLTEAIAEHIRSNPGLGYFDEDDPNDVAHLAAAATFAGLVKADVELPALRVNPGTPGNNRTPGDYGITIFLISAQRRADIMGSQPGWEGEILVKVQVDATVAGAGRIKSGWMSALAFLGQQKDSINGHFNDPDQRLVGLTQVSSDISVEFILTEAISTAVVTFEFQTERNPY